MKKNIWRRIFANRSGESLVEVLCAVLISSMAFMLLLTAVMSSSKYIQNSRARVANYNNTNSELSMQTNFTGSATATFTTQGNATVKLTADDSGQFTVTYGVNDQLKGDAVVSYAGGD